MGFWRVISGGWFWETSRFWEVLGAGFGRWFWGVGLWRGLGASKNGLVPHFKPSKPPGNKKSGVNIIHWLGLVAGFEPVLVEGK